MTNGIVYEIQRTFRSRFVIAMIGLILLVSALIGYLIATQNPAVPQSARAFDVSNMFSIVNGVFGLTIPILSVFMGYLTYGKDRTSGVLESVITRPVTKGGLMFSRFLANIVAVLVALTISVFIFDAGVYSYYATGLPSDMILALVWTYIVEAAGFIGLVYFFSHLLKTQTAVLGVSIALFLILGLLWNTISALVLLEVFHKGLATLSALGGTVVFDFASPSGYEANVLLYMTGRFIGLSSAGGVQAFSVDPASYGVTLFSLGAVGVAWIVVPVLAAYLIARKFD